MSTSAKFALAAFAGFLVFHHIRKRWVSVVSAEPVGSVSSLHKYPIKSCRGTEYESFEIGRYGVVGDRIFMIVNAKGDFQTQRQIPKMCLVSPTLLESSQEIRLSCTGQPDLTVSTEASAETRGNTFSVRVWDDHVDAVELSKRASSWISSTLGADLRLVTRAPTFYRSLQNDTKYTPENLRDREVLFSDGYPVLLISRSSLQALNSRLSQPVSMDRFRPNIVVEGADIKPFDEDTWYRVRIGSVEFLCVKPCSRCKIPDTDQQSGNRTSDVSNALDTFRKAKGHGSLNGERMFGMNLVNVSRSGSIRRGDPIVVLERRDPVVPYPQQ